MLLLAASVAFAALGTGTFDVPAPVVTDLDLLPEPGEAWPCTLTMQVDTLGAVTDVAVASGCPSGLVETARAMGRGWKWEPAATAHDETLTVRFRVLRSDEADPKPVSVPGDLTFLLRPVEIGAEPPTTLAAPTAPYRLDKGPKTKLPAGTESARVLAGTCTVRVTVGADGKVAGARAVRCLDLLAPAAVASVKKLKFTVGSGAPASAEFDLPVRFAPAE
jgi:hypothetical protein